MNADFAIPTLGPCTVDSPLLAVRDARGRSLEFVEDDERIVVDHCWRTIMRQIREDEEPASLELAGPRRHLFFRPAETGIGIVTCGGLCPGLNNVIRSLVMSAQFHYRVEKILGFRYGFRGVARGEFVELDSEKVSEIHALGGTILAASRGPQDAGAMVDTLTRLGVDVLFVIGGDGSQRGALDLAAEARRRGLKLAVVGIPKTIDNDLRFMDRSFGFATAYGKAVEVIEAAHREAHGAPNGIGLVKVMGRHSGFIACAATLASGCVNFCLIPEVPFRLEGGGGFLAALRRRLDRRAHAVIVVAEGAGQDLLGANPEDRDASGNVRLGDIGVFLGGRIKAHFREAGFEVNLKYLDPSYLIRSVPADAGDAVFCAALGLNAIHAAMAGKTEMVIGSWHQSLVHVPMRQVIAERHRVDPAGPLWLSVLEATGQPVEFG